MLNEFIAYGAEAGGAASGLLSMLPMLAIWAVVIYLMMIRPQRKKQKAHKNMLDSMKIGDKCETVGGIIGEVLSINDEVVVLKVDKGVKITFKRSSISSVEAK